MHSRNQRRRLLQEEIKRRRDESETREASRNRFVSRTTSSITKNIDPDTIVKFDRIITARVDGKTFRFDQVYEKSPIPIDFLGNHYLVKPVIDIPEKNESPQFLLTVINLDEPFWTLSAGKALIGILEKDLEIIRNIKHPNVVSLYEFKIAHTQSDGWRVHLLTEYSPSFTSFNDLLDTVETISIKVARNWASQILDGLECIHKHGVAHKLVNLDNICIDHNKSTKNSIIKLNRACFGYLLTKMNADHPFNSSSTIAFQKTWEPPELHLSNSDPLIKSDVYDFGTVLCQLLAGKDISKNFKSPRAYISSSQAFSSFTDTELFDTLINFLEHTFDPRPKNRYSVLELLTSKFIREHDLTPSIPLLSSTTSTSERRSFHSSHRSNSSHTRRMTNNSGQSFGTSAVTLSRYEIDFSQVQSLGRGAYGEVVKARHRLEGQFYAIKKIKSVMNKVEKLLGEIRLLSRLSHRYIVRYYSAWIEEDSLTLVENAITDSDQDSESDSSNSSASKSISTTISKNIHSMSNLPSLHLTDPYFEPSFSTPLDSTSGPDIVFGYSSSDAETDDQASEQSESESESEEEEEEEEEDELSGSSEIKDKSNKAELSVSFDHSDKENDSASQNKLTRNNSTNKKKPWSLKSLSVSTNSSSGSALLSPYRTGSNSSYKRNSQLCTLFIQMEYCENHTLADLIKDELFFRPDDYWRLLSQIVDALGYIHVNGIIHRDLKPVNIFIDQEQNVKIGDFGLARTVNQPVTTTSSMPSTADELTKEVGTGLYIAPEVLSADSSIYDSKIDMYSLGIIFFEMVFPMTTAMERVTILRKIRNPNCIFPSEFVTPKFSKEYQIVSLLVDHDPTKRPSAKALQKSPLIPTPREEELFEKTLQKVFNARGDSRLIAHVCNAIFSKELDTISAVLYDRDKINDLKLSDYILLQRLNTSLSDIFRGHGAIQTDDRPIIFPKPGLYEYNNTAQFIDRFGTILQLPYDLTYSFARKLAQKVTAARKNFVFGNVYRECQEAFDKSTEPRKCSEVSFDIVNNAKSSIQHEVYDDAETIKVLQEIVSLLPCFNKESVTIVLNHGDILNSILNFCSIPPSQYSLALMLLGPFGQAPAPLSAKAKFLDQKNMTSSTMTDLEQFGFQESLEESEFRILGLMRDSNPSERFYKAITYLRRVEHLLKVMGVKYPIIHAPLSHYNHKFYKGGIMFQVVLEEKKQKTNVLLAAGGRYNSLISMLRTNMGFETQGFYTGAVGFNMSMDICFKFMKRYVETRLKKKSKSDDKRGSSVDFKFWTEPRCDVFVCTSKEGKKERCFEILNILWGASINADYLSSVAPSDQILCAEAENIPFLVSLQQSSYCSLKNFRPIRITLLPSRESIDVKPDELISKLTAMIRERRTKILIPKNPELRRSKTASYVSISTAVGRLGKCLESAWEISTSRSSLELSSVTESGRVRFEGTDNGNDSKIVKVLSEMPTESSSKIEQEALASIMKLKNSLKRAEAYYSLDVDDDVLDAILKAPLESVQDWNQKVVSLSVSQMSYLLDTQEKLLAEKMKGTKSIYLYSTRTGRAVVYHVE